MTTQSKIREILADVYEGNHCGEHDEKWDKKLHFKALSAIIAILLEDLPKESLSRATANGAFYHSEYDEGFNDCLKQVKEILK